MYIIRMEWDFNFGLLPYGQLWRRHRRAFHEHFHPNAVKKYEPVQTREVHALIKRLLESPKNFRHHIRQ